MTDPAKATLTLGETTIELPVVRGSENERAIDIAALRSKTGFITLDPGYGNTGSCESAITFIDGDRGILRYRGYPIEELAEHSSFIETAYLLMKGELPTREELERFRTSITYHTMIHEDMRRFHSAFPKDAHPMAVLAAAVSALSSFYPDTLDPEVPEQVEKSVHRLIAKLPSLAAYAYKHSIGQPLMYPRNELGYSANFLQMLFGTPAEDYEVDPVVRDALDLLFILHADHEQNCSTSTMRIVGSSMANLFASTSAAISALWGPRHGGANQSVIEMLIAIRDQGLTPKQFVDKAKDKDAQVRLFGFGHRVYKNFDPRAKIIKKAAYDVLDRIGVKSKLLEIAVELETIALEDSYFVERKLYPNVDFYSGIIYNAIGIPMNMFTAMFAIGRLPGWIAQWQEMHSQGHRISRPRQIYTGATERAYVPVVDR